jgi:hypothetical protein
VALFLPADFKPSNGRSKSACPRSILIVIHKSFAAFPTKL